MTTNNIKWKVGDVFSFTPDSLTPDDFNTVYRLIGKLPNDRKFYVYPTDKDGKPIKDKPYSTGYKTIASLINTYECGNIIKKINKPEVKHEWKVGDVFSICDIPVNKINYRLLAKLPSPMPHDPKILLVAYEVDKTGKKLCDNNMICGKSIEEIMNFYTRSPFALGEFICNINDLPPKREWKVGDVFSVVTRADEIQYRVIIERPTERVGYQFAAMYANEKGQVKTITPAAVFGSVAEIIKFYSEDSVQYKMGEYICNVNDKPKYKYSADTEFIEEVKCGKQRGIIVGFVVTTNGEAFPAVGWSLCHKTDTFDYEMGLGLANANAMGWKVTKYDRTIPHPLKKPFNKMKSRMQRIVRQLSSNP